MGRSCAFAVNGSPRRWKRPAQGRHPKTGKPMRFEDKQAAADKKVIATCARLAWKGDPVCGPVMLGITAIFPIPPSWPEPVKQAAAEGRVMHIQDPDLDQLLKLVKDALTGIVYIDDNQVARYPPMCKRYGSPARTEVRIEVIDQEPDEITPGQHEVRKRAEKAGMIAKAPPTGLFAPTGNRSKSDKDRRP